MSEGNHIQIPNAIIYKPELRVYLPDPQESFPFFLCFLPRKWPWAIPFGKNPRNLREIFSDYQGDKPEVQVNKEEEHRFFRKEAMGEKRARHEAMMQAYGSSHLSIYLQNTPNGKYIVVYTEEVADTPSNAEKRLKQGQGATEWQEIAATLMNHTGLNLDELCPDVDWLTQPLLKTYANIGTSTKQCC